MRIRKEKGVPVLFLPVLYLLFVFFLLGCFFGIYTSLRCETVFSHSCLTMETDLSIIAACVAYHVAVFAVIWFPIGLILIPLIMFVRGLALSAAVFVLYSTGAESVLNLGLMYGLPAMFQLSSLFYIAAFGLCLHVIRKKDRCFHFKQQSMKRIKQELLCSLLFLLIGISMEWILI